MTLSAIHLLNWFYSFSLKKLSLICFCNWKKKKKKTCLKNMGKPNLTRPITRLTSSKLTRFDPQPVWPANPIDPTWTRPDRFATSTRPPPSDKKRNEIGQFGAFFWVNFLSKFSPKRIKKLLISLFSQQSRGSVLALFFLSLVLGP